MANRSVFKVTLDRTFGPQRINMGSGKIIHAVESRIDLEDIDIYYEVDRKAWHDQSLGSRRVILLETGGAVPDGYEHVMSITLRSGWAMHLYLEEEQLPDATSVFLGNVGRG